MLYHSSWHVFVNRRCGSLLWHWFQFYLKGWTRHFGYGGGVQKQECLFSFKCLYSIKMIWKFPWLNKQKIKKRKRFELNMVLAMKLISWNEFYFSAYHVVSFVQTHSYVTVRGTQRSFSYPMSCFKILNPNFGLWCSYEWRNQSDKGGLSWSIAMDRKELCLLAFISLCSLSMMSEEHLGSRWSIGRPHEHMATNLKEDDFS